MRPSALSTVFAFGLVMVAALAVAAGMHLGDALRIAVIAGGTSFVIFVPGSLTLWALRRRSVLIQTTAVALTTVVACAAGSVAAAHAMFLSSHDLGTLLVILAAAGTVGLAGSMVLGGRVATASRSLVDVARRIGDGEPAREPMGTPPADLAVLAEELEVMSHRLDQAHRKERALESSRRELIAWVSHDLRTPLAGIRAMVEALEDGVVSETSTVSAYYVNLRLETDRLSGLIDDLFELSVIQAGALNLHLEQVSLNELASDALATASVFARAKGVHLEGRMDEGAPNIALSPLEMTRALRNLLQNAIRHTPSDGTVWVETGMDAERAYLAVADECGGIPEQDLDRVFDLAFRGTSARTPNPGEGGGLGLAIVRGIVEAHQGEVSVRNEGQGCRFVVRLPVERVSP